MKFILLFTFMLVLTSCGQDSGGEESSSGTTLRAKSVVIDNRNYVSMLRAPQSDSSIMSFLIPKAFADGFVTMEPYFVPYYQGFSLASESEITIIPRIAYDTNTGDADTAERGSLVNLIEDKYYHFTVARKGGGVFTDQTVTVALSNYHDGAFDDSGPTNCGLSIASTGSGDSANKGDIIVKTDLVNGNTGTNNMYYSAAIDYGVNATEGACYFKVSLTTNSTTYTKYIGIGKILDLDATGANDYPDIESLSFDGTTLNDSNEITIDYNAIEQITDASGDQYKYGTWSINQSSTNSDNGSVTSISRSYWQFTCGGGGSEGKWLEAGAGFLSNDYYTGIYSDYYDIDGDGTIEGTSGGVAADDDSVADAKKFYWRVGGCQEMLMLVSVIDSNKNLVQKKVAIISE